MKKVFTAKPIRTVFHMEPEHRKALDAISKKTGAPLAELLRRAVELYLKAQRRK
jgi:predicted DNA-binding protein